MAVVGAQSVKKLPSVLMMHCCYNAILLVERRRSNYIAAKAGMHRTLYATVESRLHVVNVKDSPAIADVDAQHHGHQSC